MGDVLHGKITPRTYTKREGAGTRAPAFISFCENVLKDPLLPWQKWLAEHALITDSDGHYIYRNILVIVARQNGKTTFATKLAAWWLFEDIAREADRIEDAGVLGFAQNIETALKPWHNTASLFSNDEKIVLGKYIGTTRANPILSEKTHKIYTGNGAKNLLLNNGVTYRARDAVNARGESASRVLLDEVREQTNMDGWASVKKLTRTFMDGQVWAITSGADAKSVLQHDLYARALSQINNSNATFGLFEWSAPQDASLDDIDAVLQANPSIGHIPALTVERVMQEQYEETELIYRTESLAISHTNVSEDNLYTYLTLSDLQRPQPAKTDIVSACAVEFVTADRAYSGVMGVTRLNDGTFFVGMLTELRATGLYGREALTNFPYLLSVSQYSQRLPYGEVHDLISSGKIHFLEGSNSVLEGLSEVEGVFQLGELNIKKDAGYFDAIARGLFALQDTTKVRESVYNKRDIVHI